MTDDVHSTYEMVKGLHARFDSFEKRIDGIETRVSGLEKGLAADVAHLERHESEANLKGEAMLDKLNMLITAFTKHAEAEEQDRRDVIKGLRNTNLSILIAAATILVTGFGLLWKTGVLA